MQSDNRIFDDFVKFVNGAAGTMAGMAREGEAAARERGCVSIELIGRKGWARLLPSYQQKAIVLRKAL